MISSFSRSSLPRKCFLVTILLILVSGCAETRQVMRYGQAAEEKVWPPAPETPRFRYVGQLTGEANFKDVEEGGAGKTIANFFRALVGLGSEGAQTRTLHRPQSGLVDSTGRILVTDVGRNAIYVFDEKQGKFSVWNAASEEYSFASPVGIAEANSGDFLVTDSKLKRVIRLDNAGNPKGEFGSEDFGRPTGIAVDPSTGRIYVADTDEHNIKVFDESGKQEQVIGQGGAGNGEFNTPTHLAFLDNILYVTDTFNARIQLLDPQGKFIKSIGKRGLFIGNLVRPKGVTADSEGNVYIIESFHDFLLVYDRNGRFLLPIGGTGSDVGQFYLPAGVWSDNRDRIYVADMFNGRVVIFQYLREGEATGSKAARQPVLKNGLESR